MTERADGSEFVVSIFVLGEFSGTGVTSELVTSESVSALICYAVAVRPNTFRIASVRFTATGVKDEYVTHDACFGIRTKVNAVGVGHPADVYYHFVGKFVIIGGVVATFVWQCIRTYNYKFRVETSVTIVIIVLPCTACCAVLTVIFAVQHIFEVSFATYSKRHIRKFGQ